MAGREEEPQTWHYGIVARWRAEFNEDGLVVEQQPRATSSIPAGSQVTIFIGRFSG